MSADMASIGEPPTPERWTEMMNEVSAGEAHRLREHAILSLSHANGQRWGPLISIAEKVMTERGIGF